MQGFVYSADAEAEHGRGRQTREAELKKRNLHTQYGQFYAGYSSLSSLISYRLL